MASWLCDLGQTFPFYTLKHLDLWKGGLCEAWGEVDTYTGFRADHVTGKVLHERSLRIDLSFCEVGALQLDEGRGRPYPQMLNPR